MSEFTGEGHYLIINKQLIEMAVLILFVFLPRDFFWSLDRWISGLRELRKVEISSKEDPEIPATRENSGRREMLKDLLALPFLGGFAWFVFKKKNGKVLKSMPWSAIPAG